MLTIAAVDRELASHAPDTIVGTLRYTARVAT